MSKRQSRPQRPKSGTRVKNYHGTENRERYDAMMEIRRSNAAVPVRNKAKYDRRDFRRAAQNGNYDE